MEEFIIQCDKKGKIIGPIAKQLAHSPGNRQKLTHYATWSMVISTSGKYGIQLKNKLKHDKFGAGKWDMGVAGHNCYISRQGVLHPMSFTETLVKEAQEEVGLNVKVIDSREEFLQRAKPTLQKTIAFFFDKFHYQTKENNEYVQLAIIFTLEKKLTFEDEEVVEFRWLTPKELSLFLTERKDYCSPLPLVFKKAEKFRKKYLSKIHNTYK